MSSVSDLDVMGCPSWLKEMDASMDLDDLISKLKVMASWFQNLEVQVDGSCEEYVPLCQHLVKEEFLHHNSNDVRLLIASCIVDILRIHVPESPYKDPDQVKNVFEFFINELEGLKDPIHPAFPRYFYLLDTLASINGFNLCYELDVDVAQDIVCNLFKLIFRILNADHSEKVMSCMVNLLCSLLMESDKVSIELLNLILSNIVEPNKSSRKCAYVLAKQVIECSKTLQTHIRTFFCRSLICGMEEKYSHMIIVLRMYDLIYELTLICPNVLLPVIPYLEYKLKSTEERERLASVSVLACMFSEKDSNLAMDHQPLWKAFLGRFNDVSVPIRIKCVQHSMHLLTKHSHLKKDIIETLKLRQHDADETVRCEVVKAIVASAKLDLSIVSESEDLLNCLKERTLDKKFKIRREALQGLGLIYKNHLIVKNVPLATKAALTWIKNNILHVYWTTSVNDRIVVQGLLTTCLVPYQMESRERMIRLLYLFGTLDSHASEAFVEIQKTVIVVRRLVQEFVNTVRNNDSNADSQPHKHFRISQLTKYLPDPLKAVEFLNRFSAHLEADESLLLTVEAIVNQNTTCQACAEYTNVVLKKLGPPVMTNLYYNTIKLLLERTSAMLVDRGSIVDLLLILRDTSINESRILELGMSTMEAMERGFILISELSSIFPQHFWEDRTMQLLIELLEYAKPSLQPLVLTTIRNVKKGCSIGRNYPPLEKIIVSKCGEMLVTANPKQAKEAVRCMFVYMDDESKSHAFVQHLDYLKANLDRNNSNYRMAIVALGHIAFLMPTEFKRQMKFIISKQIVKELLVNTQLSDDDTLRNYESDWCEEDELPEITRCMMAGMKTTARWLLGLRTDCKAACNTFKMLIAFVVTGGTFIKTEVPFSKAEQSWLRLVAGCCVLKICKAKGVGDEIMAGQFVALAKLMNDPVFEVRSRFGHKLHLGLSRGFPKECLPLDFMGFYALGGYEKDQKQKMVLKKYMTSDVEKRHACKRALINYPSERALTLTQIQHIMPEYMLVFSVPVLIHNPRFSDYTDPQQLAEIKECIWFVLEPLLLTTDSESSGFYTTLLARLKNHKYALQPDDQIINCMMYAICDLARGLILQNSSRVGGGKDSYNSEPMIPLMYFKRHEDPYFENIRSYLPHGMQYSAPKNAGVPVVSESSKRKKGKHDLMNEHENTSIDVIPSDTNETRLKIPRLETNDCDDQVPVPVSNTNPTINTWPTVLSLVPIPTSSKASKLILINPTCVPPIETATIPNTAAMHPELATINSAAADNVNPPVLISEVSLLSPIGRRNGIERGMTSHSGRGSRYSLRSRSKPIRKSERLANQK